MKVYLADIERDHRYVRGVSATQEDMQAGRAVFFIDSGGKPIDITIPQYAWHNNYETKKRTLWIIVQAEENKGVRAFGAISVETGENMAGLESEFELIGNELPNLVLTS